MPGNAGPLIHEHLKARMFSGKEIGLFFRARKRTWYFILAGLLLFLLARTMPSIILQKIIAPRAAEDQQGWWASFSSPVRSLPIKGYEVFLPGMQTVALNPDFRQVTLWTVWKVAGEGRYKMHFAAEGYARLSIDGQEVLAARPRSMSRRIEKKWLRMKAGPHLIRVDIINQAGGGWMSIGVLVPPLMRFTPLQGPQIAAPRLGNLETWWWFLRLASPLAILSLVLAGAGLLSVLLPLTVRGGWPGVGLLVALALLPALLFPDLERREPYIGPMVHRQLREIQPRFVFIGNSMLWSRIDDQLLSHLLGDVPVYSIVNFGGLSGIHYLALKYLLVPSGVHPDKVFIFFRGTTLLDPSFRTTGPYFEKLIQRISPAPDPVFERLAHGRRVNGESGTQGLLRHVFRLQNNQHHMRDLVGRLALRLTRHDEPAETLRKRINERFSLENVGDGMDREALKISRGPSIPEDFSRAAENSFLPPMFELARQHGFTLVFVRVQERPEPDRPMRDSAGMKTFMARLEAYLHEHGAEFYDFTGDPDLTLRMYGQGDHIADPKQYTPLFYKRMRKLLQ